MERRHGRHLEPPGIGESEWAKEKRVYDMDHVGLEGFDLFPHEPAWDVDAQLRVDGDPRSADAYDLGAGILRWAARGAEQDDLMALFVQALQHQAEDADDPVDFRQERLGENGDPELFALSWHPLTSL